MSPSNPTPQTGGGPTIAEAKEAARRGVSVYQLRLERGGKAPTQSRRPLLKGRAWTPSPAVGKRTGDTLSLILPVIARSKKNSREKIWRRVRGQTREFYVPSKAYGEYADQVRTAIDYLRGSLALPLPAIPYAFSVVFFVPDEAADVDNLLVGLADALAAAGVLTSDNLIRSVRAEAVLDAVSPRIAFTLAPVAP